MSLLWQQELQMVWDMGIIPKLPSLQEVLLRLYVWELPWVQKQRLFMAYLESEIDCYLCQQAQPEQKSWIPYGTGKNHGTGYGRS